MSGDLRALAEAEHVVILKGIGKVTGDGWKDTTRKGEVVFVWNAELPQPYKPGQYPRVGCEVWSASTDQYDFTSATPDDLPSIRAAIEAHDSALLARAEAAEAQVKAMREALHQAGNRFAEYAEMHSEKLWDGSISEVQRNTVRQKVDRNQRFARGSDNTCRTHPRPRPGPRQVSPADIAAGLTKARKLAVLELNGKWTGCTANWTVSNAFRSAMQAGLVENRPLRGSVRAKEWRLNRLGLAVRAELLKQEDGRDA